MYIKKRKVQPKRTHVQQIAQNHSSCFFSSPTHRPNGLNSLPDPSVWVTDGVSGLLFPFPHERKFFSPNTSYDLLVAAGAGGGPSAPGWRAPWRCALSLCGTVAVPGPGIPHLAGRQQAAASNSWIGLPEIFPNYLVSWLNILGLKYEEKKE
jgi:hypothetical protein